MVSKGKHLPLLHNFWFRQKIKNIGDRVLGAGRKRKGVSFAHVKFERNRLLAYPMFCGLSRRTNRYLIHVPAVRPM